MRISAPPASIEERIKEPALNGVEWARSRERNDRLIICENPWRVVVKRRLLCHRWLNISPDGKLLHVFEIAAGDGTTNVAFGEGEKALYVTVVKDPKGPQAKGSIVKIANVK